MYFVSLYISVGHVEAFKFGFLPYEFLPPPDNDIVNGTISEARAHEIRLGMYSLRSILLPKLLSFVLLVSKMADITASPYLVHDYYFYISIIECRLVKVCSRDYNMVISLHLVREHYAYTTMR